MAVPDFKINNVKTKMPSTMTVTASDFDSESFRNKAGRLIRNRIRQGVRRLDLTWEKLTPAEVKTISEATKDSSFPVYYFDPFSNQYETKIMYVSDRKLDIKTIADKKEEMRGLSLALVEL